MTTKVSISKRNLVVAVNHDQQWKGLTKAPSSLARIPKRLYTSLIAQSPLPESIPTTMTRLPPEIWLDMACYVHRNVDLYHFICVCRAFARIGLPLLRRDLVWTDPYHLAGNLPVWIEHPELCSDVRNLRVRNLHASCWSLVLT
jgi:hypothetical protein